MTFQQLKELGVSTLPLNGKIPSIAWKHLKERLPTSGEVSEWTQQQRAIGVVCGAISGNLYCLDFDSKNDLTDEPAITTWGKIVKGQKPELLDKTLVSRTKNAGYHVIYRVEEGYELEGNLKLASRMTTETEPNYPVGTIALIETRGEGGQFVLYDLVQGSYDDIPVLTAGEHTLMLDAARALNQVIKEPKAYNKVNREHEVVGGSTPFNDYDGETSVADTLIMLTDAGWTVDSEIGDQYQLIRPGKVEGISATLNVIPERFYVFSTSTEFDSETCYKYSAVYAVLNHGGDFGAAAAELGRQGYGEQRTDKEQKELVNKMLGLDDIVIGEAEENTIMKRIKTYDQAMDEYFEFVGREQSFRLSPRFNHLMPYMRDISPGQVVGLAAASGVGKSLIINQLMADYAEEADVYGLFASLEMPARDIAIRSSMELTKPHKGNYVDKEKVTERLISDANFRKSVVEHHKRIAILDDAYELDVILEMMSLYVEHMKKLGKSVTFLTIDFQSLLTGGADVDKQADIAQKLKMYAKKLDIIIFTLQQLNGLVDKYDEPGTNNISGRRELYMALDFSFMMWKSKVSKNRIRFKNAKERWNLEGLVDLVLMGMRLHSEEYLDDDDAKIINAGRNKPLVASKGGLDG